MSENHNDILPAKQLLMQVQAMWKVIDQLNTAALDAEKGLMSSDALHQYVKRKTALVMRLVSYPGEPDKDMMFSAGLGWKEDSDS